MRHLMKLVGGLLIMGVLTLAGCGTNSLAITPPTLPAAFAGTSYSQTLTANGGSSPYTWSVATGTLPPGLTLSSAGVISGTPTTAGTSSFTIQVSDSSSQNLTATQSYTLQVSLPTALAAGQTITLTSGESILVPSGTTVTLNSNVVTVNGDGNTFNTSGGAVVSVPSTATGTADNTVVAQ
jgi:hypothetical protein